MTVTNVNGSGGLLPPSRCYSWLDYWERNVSKKACYCSRSKCIGTNLVGAHIQKAYSSDKRWYIVPLCTKCNHESSEVIIDVIETLVPVPSNL